MVFQQLLLLINMIKLKYGSYSCGKTQERFKIVERFGSMISHSWRYVQLDPLKISAYSQDVQYTSMGWIVMAK